MTTWTERLRPTPGRMTAPNVPAFAAAAAVSAAAAMSVVFAQRVAILALAACAVAIIFGLRFHMLWSDLLFVTLGGAIVLDYGFANIGLPFGVPVPIAEVLLLALLVPLLRNNRLIDSWSFPLLAIVAFVALATVRLVLDLPTWGMASVRDFTLPLELGFVFVGYAAIRRNGIDAFVRLLSVIFAIALVAFAMQPISTTLATLGPSVGLQYEVPLLGNYRGAGPAAAAAFLFFAVVRPFGRISYVFAGAFLATLALVQSRAAYLIVPAVCVLVFIVVRGQTGRRIRRGVAATLAVGTLCLSSVLVVGPSGRFGPATLGLISTQLSTLVGGEGPGAGSIHDRREWYRAVREEVRARPLGWLVGVGLGPDLIDGFRFGNNALVRKPHNDYLEVGARLGVPALLLFLAAIATTLLRTARAIRRSGGRAARVLTWILAAALVYLGVAATQPILYFPYGTIPLFTILGAGLAIVRDVAASTGARGGEAPV